MRGLHDALGLAISALRATPWRTAALVLGVAVALGLPWLTLRVGWLAEGQLLARARSTPIVVGRKGDVHDLVMSAVYFRGEVREPVTEADALALTRPGIEVIPLHTGHSAGGVPVVGTTLAYLARRGLEVARGRRPAVLGEVVVGAGVAAERGIDVGDRLRSDVRNPWDVAGAFPLLLQVVGVLAPTGQPEDDAILADLKTAWVMDGLLHGHGEIAGGDVLEGSDAHVVAAPSLFLYTEIDPSNLGSFHLHAGPEARPVSSLLLFPADQRAHDEALGALAVHDRLQAVRPEGVVRGILGIVLQVQRWLAGGLALVVGSTVAFVATVLSLSLQLRRDELTLLRRIGASRARVAAIVGAELGLVVVLGLVAALVGVELGVAWLRAWVG